jgi:hypothetical protein
MPTDHEVVDPIEYVATDGPVVDDRDSLDITPEKEQPQAQTRPKTHPLLATLNNTFSITADGETRTGPIERTIGGFLFGFRPLLLPDFVWLTTQGMRLARAATVEETDLSRESIQIMYEALCGILSVASIRKAGNTNEAENPRIPIYVMFGVSKPGVLIKDKWCPPESVRFDAAVAFLNYALRQKWKMGLLESLYATYEQLFDRKQQVNSWLLGKVEIYVCRQDGAINRSLPSGQKPHCSLCGSKMIQVTEVASYTCPADGVKLDYPQTDFFVPHCHLCGAEMVEVQNSAADPLE